MAVVLPVAAPALGQTVIERNPPPPVVRAAPSAPTPPKPATSDDDTPFGFNLAGVTLVGATPGVVVGPGVASGARGVSRGALRRAVARFIGRPLSRRLLTQIRAAITGVYRRAGYPFVSVAIPPQEIKSGTIIIRVVEFRSGGVKVKGGSKTDQARVREQVALNVGDRLSAGAVDEDFDWINRFPFRRVQGVFAPGDELGQSQLTLTVSESKPWQVFAGASNTGTRTTGMGRYFVGFAAGLPEAGDVSVSYQFTGSANFWDDPGRYDDGANRPNYVSHSAMIELPVGYHQDLEITPNYVAQTQNLGKQTLNTDVAELPVVYRTAVSNIVPGAYFGDLTIGVDFTAESRRTYILGIDAGAGAADLFQISAGWNDSFRDSLGRTTIGLRVVGDPGGVFGSNNERAWDIFTNGRVTDVETAYGVIDLQRTTILPENLTWVSSLEGVIASQALPDADQTALGGLYGVRGYQLDDASVDRGFYLRNELRHGSWPVLSALAPQWRVTDQVSPFVFLDYGSGHAYGIDSATGPLPARNYSLLGAGAGFDYQLGAHLSSNLAIGCAAHAAGDTRSGDCNVQGRVLLTF